MLRNVTLTADEHLIEQARERAQRQQTTLNVVFRLWLEGYVAEERLRQAHDGLLKRLAHVESGGPFSRDELNER